MGYVSVELANAKPVPLHLSKDLAQGLRTQAVEMVVRASILLVVVAMILSYVSRDSQLLHVRAIAVTQVILLIMLHVLPAKFAL